MMERRSDQSLTNEAALQEADNYIRYARHHYGSSSELCSTATQLAQALVTLVIARVLHETVTGATSQGGEIPIPNMAPPSPTEDVSGAMNSYETP